MKVLIAGFGDLGTQLARELQQLGHETLGLRRTASPGAICGDLSQPGTLTPALSWAEQIIFCAAPDARTPVAYENLYVRGLENLVQLRSKQPIYFCSSTAVYGQHQGEHVNESSPCEPTEFNGQILLKAERLLAQTDCVLRLGGIYGPGRDLAPRRVLAGAVGDSALQTNRIHVQDAARAIAHLLSLPLRLPVYNLVDLHPCTQAQLYRWIASELKREIIDADFVTNQQPSGKIVSAERLHASGFQWLFPSYREGYAAMLAECQNGSH